MHISGVNYESFNDAEGISCVIYVSGCLHKCKGCHSPSTWDFESGKKVTDDLINEIRSQIQKRPFLSYLTLSGGDPFYSAKEVVSFIDKLNVDLPIWIYTGFRLEELQTEEQKALLDRCSAITDGPFEIDKRDITLAFRGSSNQHIYKKEGRKWIMCR